MNDRSLVQEEIVNVPGLVQEEVVHVPKGMQQTRVQHEQVEQEVQVPVPMTQEEVVHVPKVMQQTHVQHQQVELEVQVPQRRALILSMKFVQSSWRKMWMMRWLVVPSTGKIVTVGKQTKNYVFMASQLLQENDLSECSLRISSVLKGVKVLL